ncbi:unannotated protein [freshwater metagenome]|uniref:Unannotated protein n=1 Tax=freshwater metagenome TaxID=449393 RepID=A0A6J7KBF8_9ZZZZ
MVAAGQPCFERVEDAQLGEQLCVVAGGGLGRFVVQSSGRRVAQLFPRCRGGSAGGIGAQPGPYGSRSADSEPRLGEVVIDNAVQIAVEGRCAGPVAQGADAREARDDDLVDIVGQCEFGVTADLFVVAGQESCHRHRGVSGEPFGQAQRPHAQGDDPPGPRVGTGVRRGAGEQEPTTGRLFVDEPSDRIPHSRDALPFAQQHGSLVVGNDPRVGVDDIGDGRIVEPAHSRAAAGSSRGLANGLRAVEQDCRQVAEERVEFAVDHARRIGVHGKEIPRHER